MDNEEFEKNNEEIRPSEVSLSEEGIEFVDASEILDSEQHVIDLKTNVTDASNLENCSTVSHESAEEAASQDELPQYFEFVMDDSLPSDAFYLPKEGNSSKSFEAGKNSVDLSFLNTEDSVSISDSHFIPFDGVIDNPTSSSFNENHQVACDDSMESNKSTSPTFFDSKSHLEREDLPTAEDSSLDSGLGSVDSVYANSGEESASSPDAMSAPSSPEAINSTKINKESESFVHDYDCNEEPTMKAGLKRHLTDADEGMEQKRVKKQNRVQFRDVTVFYFPRRQSFITVPSQGGSTLGMAFKHVHCQTMTLHEHYLEMRQKHIQQVKEHIRDQKIENKVKQLKFLHPDADNNALTSMATKEVELSDKCVETHEDDSLLDTVDDFFFLQPISTKKRRNILRNAGVARIDSEEKLMNRITRQSREMCGCSCDGICLPSTCECAQAGIQCQVDREAFPCSCVPNGCRNENGRIEFDSERVRCHFEATMEKLREEEEPGNCHIIFDDEVKETDSVSSIDSECENASLDSEGVAIRSDLQFHQDQTGTNVVYEDFMQAGSTWFAKTPERQMNSDSEGQDSVEYFGNYSEEISPEFLRSLGLQKIERNAFSRTEIGHMNGYLQENLTTDPESPSSSQFAAATEAILSELQGNGTGSDGDFPQQFYTLESPYYKGNPQNSYACFDNHCVTSTSSHGPSMFGTTSSKRDSGGNHLTRDCSVLLDPIATFMSSHSTLSDSLTHL